MILLLYGSLAVVGWLASLVISSVQCSKRDWLVSLEEGCIWALFPTSMHWVASTYASIRGPFVRVLQGWISDPLHAEQYAIGSLMGLVGLVGTARLIGTTEQAVCVPSVDEMAAFQKDLLAKLHAKEQAKQPSS